MFTLMADIVNPAQRVPSKPKTGNASDDVEIVWLHDLRPRPGGRQPQVIRETWVHRAVTDGIGAWTIGYRIAQWDGAPYVAEVRLWLTSSPPWSPHEAMPPMPPNLD